ncbi:DUF3597 domain-containing protein [Ramlibacter algicola]|uniref:DUF3597 domain-containing protein n=1 Tax=Ramlibacter algicola TaxID=2795217 RepID=A0A934UTA4_9BURK|nr:DUF3597 domain-containing protein [Ramlibacter algicola]MBK0394568.1 DUF3597 domain-containing protein [Ramlibacter algicola]
MSILTSIFNKILHRGGDAPAAAPTATNPPPRDVTAQAGPASVTGAVPPTAPAPAPAMSQVDVEAVLNGMAKDNPQKLNWRTSIVDLMKLLDLDSSLQARKQLADELHYTGDKNDSASMNIWLHKQVMQKLAANGGKVPADLKD